MPALQIIKLEIADPNAEEVFDAISDGFKHATNLPIYSLPQDNAKTCRRDGAKPRNFRALSIKKNSTQQLGSERRIPRSIQRQFIFFVDFETGMGEALREVTVVRQKQ